MPNPSRTWISILIGLGMIWFYIYLESYLKLIQIKAKFSMEAWVPVWPRLFVQEVDKKGKGTKNCTSFLHACKNKGGVPKVGTPPLPTDFLLVLDKTYPIFNSNWLSIGLLAFDQGLLGMDSWHVRPKNEKKKGVALYIISSLS